MAIVYKAYVRGSDGNWVEIAVKCNRPGIADAVATDKRILEEIGAADQLRMFINTSESETEMSRELADLRELREVDIYKSKKGGRQRDSTKFDLEIVRLSEAIDPDKIQNLASEDKIIVMDMAEGSTLGEEFDRQSRIVGLDETSEAEKEVTEIQKAEATRKLVALSDIYSYLMGGAVGSLFNEKKYFGDPNPSNIIVRYEEGADGKPGRYKATLIDVGGSSAVEKKAGEALGSLLIELDEIDKKQKYTRDDLRNEDKATIDKAQDRLINLINKMGKETLTPGQVESLKKQDGFLDPFFYEYVYDETSNKLVERQHLSPGNRFRSANFDDKLESLINFLLPLGDLGIDKSTLSYFRAYGIYSQYQRRFANGAERALNKVDPKLLGAVSLKPLDSEALMKKSLTSLYLRKHQGKIIGGGMGTVTTIGGLVMVGVFAQEIKNWFDPASSDLDAQSLGLAGRSMARCLNELTGVCYQTQGSNSDLRRFKKWCRGQANFSWSEASCQESDYSGHCAAKLGNEGRLDVFFERPAHLSREQACYALTGS